MYAVAKLDPAKIDYKIVDQYMANRYLLDALDEWVLNPDYTLLPKLYKMRDLINKIQPHRDAKTKLYRGFSINGNMQNFFGLTPDESFGDPKKTHRIVVKDPTSFTTSPTIAADFGDCVISTTPGAHLKHFLRMTDEVSAAVCQCRNIEPETQYEWVFLPTSPCDFDVRFMAYKKPSWYKFW